LAGRSISNPEADLIKFYRSHGSGLFGARFRYYLIQVHTIRFTPKENHRKTWCPFRSKKFLSRGVVTLYASIPDRHERIHKTGISSARREHHRIYLL